MLLTKEEMLKKVIEARGESDEFVGWFKKCLSTETTLVNLMDIMKVVIEMPPMPKNRSRTKIKK